jgi:hypothetical protein
MLNNTTARIGTALAVPLAALAFTTSAGAVGRYTDAAGDGKGGPDISSVAVASDATGQIVFTISAGGLPAEGDTTVFVGLNTDLNEATGGPNTLGADYMLVDSRSDHMYSFGRWTGSDWDWDTPSTTVTVQASDGSTLISVNRSELGNTGEFGFWVRAIQGDASAGQLDDAPDVGAWNYSLQGDGPRIDGVLVHPLPSAGPKAAKPFTLTAVRIRTPSTGGVALAPHPDSYSCRAKLAGKAFAGSGTGGCTWKIPKTARGKTLTVVITATYEGASKSVPFTFRVS